MVNIVDNFLSVTPWSRPGKLRPKTAGVVVHWSGWLGQPVPAANVRSYFELLGKQKGALAASSNFVIGCFGEILRLMPDDEMSYCSGWYDYAPFVHERLLGDPNRATVSIEVCAQNEQGEYSPVVYAAQVALVAWLCEKYSLNPRSDLWRHYDVCGPAYGKKDCPRYFVTNPAAWDQFRADVQKAIK